MKPIIVKINVISRYLLLRFEEDYTNYAKSLVDCREKFKSNNELITKDNVARYFKSGKFKASEIENLRGEHFIYGWFINYIKSKDCPSEIKNSKGEIFIEVEQLPMGTKHVGAVTIGKLIEAHMKGDNEMFLSYANFIADAFEEDGDERGARIIRKRIDGTMDAEPQVTLD